MNIFSFIKQLHIFHVIVFEGGTIHIDFKIKAYCKNITVLKQM